MHRFQECLKKSQTIGQLPIWELLYRRFFPDFAGMFYHEQDGYHQRLGVDRSITLSHGKQVLIDEKVRFKDWGDILLEYISNDRTNAPGWVCKPLLCDYIHYLVFPSVIERFSLSNSASECEEQLMRMAQEGWLFKEAAPQTPNDLVGKSFLLPVIQLQKAWQLHKEKWKKTYGSRSAPNVGYNTLSVPVKVPELFGAIGACFRDTFSFEPMTPTL